MANTRQLPYLLKLLEDDSPIVRDAVLRELKTFGPLLEDELVKAGFTPTDQEAQVLHPILDEHRRQLLLENWERWNANGDDKEKLEAGLALLAEFQCGRHYPSSVPRVLDELAVEYFDFHPKRDARQLARFLFVHKGLEGAPEQSYYEPLNSNLVRVVERKKGIPISLACVYILVGRRLNLDIEGCNFPGHFLAIAPMRAGRALVDCYSGGRILTATDLASIKATVSMEDILRLQCGANAILARVLRNLVAAYQRAHDQANADCMKWLLHRMGDGIAPPAHTAL